MNLQGLYLVLSNPKTGFEKCTAAAVACNVSFVQLRIKKGSRDEILAVGKTMRELTRGTATRFIVNDDVTIAHELDADGVHLGQDDMSIEEARRLWPEPGKIFGLSTHNLRQVQLASLQAPDYIGIGPVFTTPTKEIPDPVLGLETMSAMINAAGMPYVVIGGINQDNLASVAASGAKAFAIVRAVTQADDPVSAICELQNIWQKSVAR